MVTIVALLYSWERTVTSARQSLPDTLQPVVDSMLVELGGLGFIGLFLSVAVVDGPLGSLVGSLSQQFLGNSAILLESFEFLHQSFFEVALCFFFIASITVTSVVRQVKALELVSRTVFDLNGDGHVSLGEVAQVLKLQPLELNHPNNFRQESSKGDPRDDLTTTEQAIQYGLQMAPRSTIWNRLFATFNDIQAEALLVRERFLQEYRIAPDSFLLETYFVKVFGNKLQDMVELSPLTWLPLIPVVAQGRSIDLSHNIVSAASDNAFTSCGEFLASPAYLSAQTVALMISVVWGLFDFWKMVQLKSMLVPTLVRIPLTNTTTTTTTKRGNESSYYYYKEDEDSVVVLLPPRYQCPELLAEFDSSPLPFGWVESLWGAPARNDHEALFGRAGRNGPALYQKSIQLHTWWVVALLVFLLGQVVLRDLSALVQELPPSVGRPDLVRPEVALYGTYTTILMGQLWLLPKTFLDYTLVTSIESLMDLETLTTVCTIDGVCEVDYVERDTSDDNNQKSQTQNDDSSTNWVVIPKGVTSITRGRLSL